MTKLAILLPPSEDSVARAIGNAVVVKLDQIGTVTATLEAMRLCCEAGYGPMVSHRSGASCGLAGA